MARLVGNNGSIEYTMSPVQSEGYALGEHVAHAVVEAIAEEMEEFLSWGITVIVLDEPGSYAFTLTRERK